MVLAFAHYFKCQGALDQLRTVLTEAEKYLESRFLGVTDHSLMCAADVGVGVVGSTALDRRQAAPIVRCACFCLPGQVRSFPCTHSSIHVHSRSLPTFWAEAEAQLQGQAAEVALPESTPGWPVWEAVLRSPLGWRRRAWAAAISFELRHGGPAKVRRLYQRCHRRKLEDGGQVRLLQDWLLFEELFGK